MKRLLAAAVALAVVGTAAWVLLRREREAEREQRVESRLLAFDDRAVSALVLTVEGTDWRFERRATGWRLTSPIEDAADGAVLQTLLTAARNSEVVETIDDPEALGAYGLEPPRGTLQLEGVDAPALVIGDRTPHNDGLYARVGGRPGVLVLEWTNAGPLTLLDPVRFRDSRLSNVPRAAVRGVSIRKGGSTIRVEREDGAWWITRPLRLPGDAARVERLFAALDDAAVQAVFDGTPSDDPRFGLGADALEIVLDTDDGSRAFRLGHARDGLRFVLRDDRPMVLGVGEEVLERMPLELDGLVSTRLTNVNRYKVTRFTYRRGGDTAAASRTDAGAWATADGRPVEDEQIYSLLVRILEARVEGWRRGAAGGGTPLASLEFEAEDREPDRIEFLADGAARVASLPGVTFRVSAPPPPVPANLVSG